MKAKKLTYPPLQIGASFLLVIFIILSMVIFAVLSLSSALKDYAYSTKNAARTTEYYTANNLAEETLAEIISDRILDKSDVSAGNESETISETVTFTVPINESAILEVAVEIDFNDPSRYQILTWKQTSITDWNGDQTLPVLGSE